MARTGSIAKGGSSLSKVPVSSWKDLPLPPHVAFADCVRPGIHLLENGGFGGYGEMSAFSRSGTMIIQP